MASDTVNLLTPPIKEEEAVELMHKERPKYTLFKLSFMNSISFILFGYTKLGHLKRANARQDIYLFNCKTHGLQIAPASGWSNRLVCTECLNDVNAELNSKINHSDGVKELSSIKELKKYLTKNNDNNK
jgi:hypothetical protein